MKCKNKIIFRVNLNLKLIRSYLINQFVTLF